MKVNRKSSQNTERYWPKLLSLSVFLVWTIASAAQTVSEFVPEKNFDLDSLSRDDLSKLLDSIIKRRQNGQVEKDGCANDFIEKPGIIIRTRDSLKNGAVFLKAPDDIETLDECKDMCCRTTVKETSRSCDLAVFQMNDDNPMDKQPKCFLFSCTKNGEFICITSANADYSVLKRKVTAEENQLLNVAMSTTTSSKEASKPVETTHAVVVAETTTKKTVTPTTTSAVVKTTTSMKTMKTTAVTDEIACPTVCGRLDWKCDNGCCISLKQVCNNHKDCSDNSDETVCDSAEHESKEESQVKSSKETTTILHAVSRMTTLSTLAKNDSTVAKSGNIQISVGLKEHVGEKTRAQKGAVLPLALGLSVTACILLMVACRLRIMKKKLRRRGKPLTMEESDYLINGMYL